MQSSTHICDNRENGHPVEDFLPGSNAAGLCCHRTSELRRELPGVHPHLDDVVDKCQQGCQGEGGDEQGDEPKLDHWETERPFYTNCISFSFLNDVCLSFAQGLFFTEGGLH